MEDDCRTSETPLRLLPGGRSTACLHYERWRPSRQISGPAMNGPAMNGPAMKAAVLVEPLLSARDVSGRSRSAAVAARPAARSVCSARSTA